MLDPTTRKQLDKTTEKHKKIDEKFLDERIKPRVIIFMEDGTNLIQSRPGKHEVPIFTKRGPNNVAININKYIAKYDFDIARKIKLNQDDKVDADSDEEKYKPSEKEIRQLYNTNAILEILQVCSNELAKEGEYY